MKSNVSAVGYMPYLDGIRAFAVGGVIIEHWSSGLPTLIRDIVKTLDLSRLGVECFFVLSGFLITLILLESKEATVSVRTALGHFYIRRVLRIFPAYYLTLLVLYVVLDNVGGVVNWHALYMSNLYSSWTNEFMRPGPHFWSLAVEEQFYLFWPLAVLTLSTSRLCRLALLLFALGPISRIVIAGLNEPPGLAFFMFPFTALDLLCFGAILACLKKKASSASFAQYSRTLYLAGAVSLCVYWTIVFTSGYALLFELFARTLAALFFGALIVASANGISGISAWTLGNPVVVWIGMVSYGLYIYHMFIPKLYVTLGNFLGLDLNIWGTYYIRFPLMIAALFLLAAMSFYLIERPIRGMKKYFT